MYPPSPYATPVGSFQTSVPLVTSDPQAGQLVYIGLNPDWLPYIVGSLFQLLLQSTWNTNDLNALSLQQQRVWNLIDLFNKSTAPTLNELLAKYSIGVEDGSEIMIRQSPTNPCLLESSVNGVDWCVWADLSKCKDFGTQPGEGSPQPPSGGGTVQYCKTLSASGTFLLPTNVNTGDVITVDSINGAGWDGVETLLLGPLYRCPDGGIFFAGQCGGGSTTSGTDPVPSSPHMSLVVSINGTFYPLVSGVFTVPSGISNAQAFIQMNDDDLSNNQGSYDFCITVTNNQSATFSHFFDLQLSEYIFTPFVGIGGHLRSTFSPGNGFEPGDTDYPGLVQFITTGFASRVLTEIDVTISTPLSGSTHSVDVGVPDSSNGNLVDSSVLTTFAVVFPPGGIAGTNFFINVQNDNNFGGSAYSGFVTGITVKGIGTDPF